MDFALVKFFHVGNFSLVPLFALVLSLAGTAPHGFFGRGGIKSIQCLEWRDGKDRV